ncbi:MAG: Fic family protein, partial [Geminicoccaceae bacterium]
HALEEGDLHPLLIISIFVVHFLAIHPFQDGNSRLSRVLTALQLLRADYAYVLYNSLESVIEQSKGRYYMALRRTQGTLQDKAPDWQPWLRFFLNTLHAQKKKLEQKMEREHALHDALPLLAVQILDLVREHGRMTTGEIEKLTGESHGTIKLRLKKLVEQRHLVRYGQGRSTWYALRT